MPYIVKGGGPSVLRRIYETEDEANRKRDEFKLEPLYAGQEIVVEYQAFIEREPGTPRKPGRQKSRPRGRSGSRGGGRRSFGGGGSPKLRQKRRGKRRPSRRSGRRS